MLQGIGRLRDYGLCALKLGADVPGMLDIFWRETKNIRAQLRLDTHRPRDVYALRTRRGPLYFRDNFGDITNLPNLFYREVYRPSRALGPGAILDVGANIGLAAAWFDREYPGHQVHCFEPLDENANLINLNCPAARVNRVAVGRARGSVELAVDRDAVMASTIHWSRAVATRQLDVITLDDYTADHRIERIAMLKIDTEGMELDVLAGAGETLRRTAQVAMETHGQERHGESMDLLRAGGLTIAHAEFGEATGMVFALRPDAPAVPPVSPPGTATTPGAWTSTG